MKIPVSIKVGSGFYHDGNYHSTNLLSEAGLWKADDVTITSILTRINSLAADKSGFMFMNAGYGKLWTSGGIELQGDGQWTWEVTGEFKMHSRITSSGYSSGQRPGVNNTTFKVCLADKWMKRGWLVIFEDGYTARIEGAPTPMSGGSSYEYVVKGIYPDKDVWCSLTNLAAGKYVRESVYPVADKLSIGTSDNAQTFPKAIDQLGHFRWSERITGNIANARVTTVKLDLGDGKVQEYWLPYAYLYNRALQEYKLSRFLFEESVYNRDENGIVVLKDEETNEVIPLGASIKQKIMSFGNFASYGWSFNKDFFDKTFGDITYAANSDSVEFVGYAGREYMNDFHNMIMHAAGAYTQSIGDNMIKKVGADGLAYGGSFVQYRTPSGHLLTLVHEKMLDRPEDKGKTITHPRTGKPIASHSCYWIPKGLTKDGMPMMRLLTQKGRAFMHGIVQGFTPTPGVWGSGDPVNGGALMKLATERDEASIHYWRTIGCQIDNLDYCFYHYSSLD